VPPARASSDPDDVLRQPPPDAGRVPEMLSVPEVAHQAGHAHGHAAADRREELVEILEAVLLAVVAVATAWSGYQAARWDGRQADLYGVSSRERAAQTQALARGGQFQLYDATNFSFWLQATAAGDRKAEALFRRRFRPEFVPAFRAWLATRPFTNPSAPPGPQVMPQYRSALTVSAAAHGARATAAFEQGTHAREQGDRYIRNTILLATVLFLAALAPRFKVRSLRISLLCVSGILLALALYFVGTYPRA
jgi:hypothetical protein